MVLQQELNNDWFYFPLLSMKSSENIKVDVGLAFLQTPITDDVKQ
jgi:hypothetical protein